MQLTKSLTSLSVATFGGAVFSFVSADIAQAVTFTFDGGDFGLSTIVKTVDGITLTVSNPSPDSIFVADGEGLAVLGDSFGIIDSFDLTFSSSVQLNSYTVGFIQSLNGNEVMTLSDGTSTSVENSPFAIGLRNFNNQFTVAAGQTISVTSNGVDPNELIQWSAIEVTPVEEPTSVPEPGSMLGLLALGGLGAKSAVKKLKK
ncbi:MAG: PEP-CTERM sorting domain-containing protein [Crocosphaera sp.]